jgi:glycosyltransferase involved in cell wall biosynthesis
VPTSPSFVGKTREQLREELSLSPCDRVIAIAGPLKRSKQFDEAIWCFELVRVLHDNARMIIFGDGPDRQRLERFADEVSDPGCVRFVGYRDDFRELVVAADVFWQLDASQATPMASLEAQAAGVPVLASDVPAHRVAILNNEYGLLVPLGARGEVARATDRLFSDAASARRLGAGGATNVLANWSIDRAIRAYERLYGDVFAKEEVKPQA